MNCLMLIYLGNSATWFLFWVLWRDSVIFEDGNEVEIGILDKVNE